MAYKLSNRQKQDEISSSNNDPDKLDLGKIATVFIIFGLLGLLTAWVYSMEIEKVANTSFRPAGISGSSAEIGPINVRKHNESYNISINADLPVDSWASIEGQVLDSNKQYLFSFGKEMWHETGYDDGGGWDEADDEYDMGVTFTKPGTYYLQFNTESSRTLGNVKVKISKKRGSSIPHMWFGIIMLVIGIALTVVKDRKLKKGRS